MLTYITFDAGSNVISKIFGLLDQVFNLITPLNIADSATTGENHLVTEKGKRIGVKNVYAFPDNGESGAPLYQYTSNVISQNYAGLNLTLNSDVRQYNEENKYNFQVNLQIVDDTPSTTQKYAYDIGSINNVINNELQFSSDEKSGPSVSYLSEMIQYVQNKKDGSTINPKDIPAPESKMINLRQIVDPICASFETIAVPDQRHRLYEHLIEILFDMKRSGDWEQCNSAYVLNTAATPEGVPPNIYKGRVILCTIDRLCALYSKCIGQSNIWHYSSHIICTRFIQGLTDEEMAEITAANAAKKAAADIKKIDSFILHCSQLYPLLSTIREKIIEICPRPTNKEEQGASGIQIIKPKQNDNAGRLINMFGQTYLLDIYSKINAYFEESMLMSTPIHGIVSSSLSLLEKEEKQQKKRTMLRDQRN